MTETQTILCVVFLVLAPLAGAGLAVMNAGLGRTRNAAHSMMAALCVIAVAACVYFICGHGFQGFPGGNAHILTTAARGAGNKRWDWLGAEPWFLSGLPLTGLTPGALVDLHPWLYTWFGIIAVGLAGLIPLGSGADRWRLGAVCASTALLSGLTFPVFAHWAWGGGWMAQLGANHGLGRGYLDAGGSGTIQAVGGLTALAITWIIGARRGKYSSDGMPMAIPGHNAVLVSFGCMIALGGVVGIEWRRRDSICGRGRGACRC